MTERLDAMRHAGRVKLASFLGWLGWG